MPVGDNAVRGGVRATYDRSRDFLPVEAAYLGTVHGVWGGYGARVAGSPPTEKSWEGKGSEMALRNHGPWLGAMYLQDGLPNLWGTAQFTYRGVSGTGGDADGDVGSFLSPAYP